MRIIARVRRVHVFCTIAALLQAGAAGMLLTDALWHHVQRHTLHVEVSSRYSITIIVVPLMHHEGQLPIHLKHGARSSRLHPETRGGVRSARVAVSTAPDILHVLVMSENKHSPDVMIGAFTLSRRVLAVPLLLVPLLWFVYRFILWHQWLLAPSVRRRA